MSIELPDDFKNALERANAMADFLLLPPSHQQAHIDAVEKQKKPETRKKQIGRSVHMVRSLLDITAEPKPKPKAKKKKK